MGKKHSLLQGSTPLQETDQGFYAFISTTPLEKVSFKFIVDGEWKLSPFYPSEFDEFGNENNYLIANAQDSPVDSDLIDSVVPVVEKHVETEAITSDFDNEIKRLDAHVPDLELKSLERKKSTPALGASTAETLVDVPVRNSVDVAAIASKKKKSFGSMLKRLFTGKRKSQEQ